MNKTNQIKNYYQVYLEEAEYVRGLRKETVKSSKTVMNYFIKLMPEVISLEDLSPNIITEFFKRIIRKAMIENREVKKSTIYSYHARLNPFFGWLESQGYIKNGSLYNRVPKPETPTYTNDMSLSKLQIEILIATISLHNVNNTFLGNRDTAIIMTLLYTGIRRGELLNLRINDINFDSKTILINATTSKSKKYRRIPLNPVLIITLKQYLRLLKSRNIVSGNLFVSRRGTSLTKHGMKSWVAKYVKLSGVSFSMHKLRHTFACSLVSQNADIASIKYALGHSSVLMTDRYIRSIGSESTRAFIDLLSY